jgi:hypothetical protein
VGDYARADQFPAIGTALSIGTNPAGDGNDVLLYPRDLRSSDSVVTPDSALGLFDDDNDCVADRAASIPIGGGGCSVGDWAAVDDFFFSVTDIPTCGISFFGPVDSGVCPLAVDNFGSNGSVPFSLKPGTTDTVQASGLEINGQSGHSCEMALTLDGGMVRVSLSCTDGMATCQDEFDGFHP